LLKKEKIMATTNSLNGSPLSVGTVVQPITETVQQIHLPEELMIKIFMHLNLEGIKACGLVCKYLNRVAGLNPFWRNLLQRDFSRYFDPNIKDFLQAYMQAYKKRHLFRANFPKVYRARDIPIRNMEIRACSAFAATSKRIAIGYNDGSIRITDKRADTWVSEDFRAHTDKINSLVFSGEEMLISGSEDHKVCLWDLNARVCVEHSLNHTSGVTSIIFRKKILISGARDGKVTFSSPSLLQKEQAVISCEVQPGSAITALAINDAFFFIGLSDGMIKSYDGDVCACFGDSKTFTATLFTGHTKPITSLVADDETLVSGSYDETIKFWDLKGNCTKTLETTGKTVHSLAIVEGRLVSSFFDVIKVWDLKTFGYITKLPIRCVYGLFTIVDDGQAILSIDGYTIYLVDFMADENQIFEELALLFDKMDKRAYKRFLNMPKIARIKIYEELYKIRKIPSIDDPWKYAEYSFQCTWKEHAQAIRNYLENQPAPTSTPSLAEKEESQTS